MKKLSLKTNRYKGKLLVFEGTDGAGKSTLITMTAKYIEESPRATEVLCVKQPTDLSRKTKLFQKMMYSSDHGDIDYRAVQFLTMSDRLQHSFEVIEPALSAGKTVICDRYIFTSLANMLARGYRKEKWFYEACKYLIRPDLTILADVPPEVAIQRIKARPSECDRFLDEELLSRVHGEFQDMSRREKFMVLGTTRPADKTFPIVASQLKKRGIV